MIDALLEAVNGIVEILSIISVPAAAAIDRLWPKTLLFAFDAKLLQGHTDIFSGIGLRHKARPPSFDALKRIVDPPVERTLPRYPGKGATPGASVRGIRRLSDKFANGVRGPLFF